MMLKQPGNDGARIKRTRVGLEGLAGLLDARLAGRAPSPTWPVGHKILGQFRVERVLWAGEQRNLYAVECVEGSLAARQCWECGFEHNLTDAAYCAECGMALVPRTFCLSERWGLDFGPYLQLPSLGLFHSSLGRVFRVFEDQKKLYLLTDMIEGGTLAEMSSPLSTDFLVEVGIKVAQALAQFEASGVAVGTLTKRNVAFNEGAVFLHDPDLARIFPEGLPEHLVGQAVEQLGRILREFVAYDAGALRALLDEVAEGRYRTAAALIAALEGVVHPPQLGGTEVVVGAMSDVGMTRTLNEDNWGWEKLSDDLALYVVADGMGGHDSGEVASELAVRTLLREMRRRVGGKGQLSQENLENALDESFQDANNAVKGFSERRRSDMGTTLVCVLHSRAGVLVIANVGDSRVYLCRDGTLKQLSQDHSLVANLVAMGKITPEAARSHPHSNILIRTVGKEWDVEIDVTSVPVRPGDRILLCSDGLWGEVEDHTISSILRDNLDPPAACRELIRAANMHGGRDNITAVIVKIP